MNSTDPGPHHINKCPATDWHYSGNGYNRVRVCACGAEDHDPEDIMPHKREPIPPIRLYAIDYALIITAGALIGAWLVIAFGV